MDNNQRFRDQVAVVTGGSTGIGFATARLLAEGGARVAILARGEETGESAARKLREAGSEATFFRANVADIGELPRVVEAVSARLGHPTILVNNAGGHVIAVRREAYPASALEDFRATVELNLVACYELARLLWPGMISVGGGAIVNVSSVSAVAPNFAVMPRDGTAGPPVTSFAYSAAKAGLESLTRWQAMAGSRVNIRANAVRPGLVRTRITEIDGKVPMAATTLPRQLVPRVGEPADLAAAIAFLASADAAFITGEVISVDGGFAGKM